MKRILEMIYFVSLLTSSTSSGSLQIINKECAGERRGTCVNIWNCPYYSDLMHRTTNPRPLPVIRKIRKNLCGFVSTDTPEVCCRSPLHDNKPVVVPTSDDKNPNRTALSTWKDKLKNHRNYHELPGSNCGPVAAGFRITAGSGTAPGEFPWMALIAYSREDELPEFRCGGTVINEHFVLTAAHCIEKSSILGVRLGEYNILTDRDCDKFGHNCAPPVQDFLISRIIIHPRYDPDSFANDIALIKLATPVNFTSGGIRPICLPADSKLIDLDLTHRQLTVSGWGVTEEGDKSAVLLKVKVPVLSSQECQHLYEDFKLISGSQICAGGYRGRDSCAGDSGGPLKMMVPLAEAIRFVQFGIVSYGPRYCGMDDRPGVYTRVSSYMEWILDNL